MSKSEGLRFTIDDSRGTDESISGWCVDDGILRTGRSDHSRDIASIFELTIDRDEQ